MQILNHKNKNLTIAQKFFIEKSIEMLYHGTIDSYRVKLNNPKTILQELKYCIDEFEIGRIKHFHTIKGKDSKNKGLVDEAFKLIKQDINYLEFKSVSKGFLENSLREINENNYKKVSATIDILLNDNCGYLLFVIEGVKALIDKNITDFQNLYEIDLSLNILFSELVNKGFSKGFLYKVFYGIFVHSLNNSKSFNQHFENFKLRILGEESPHTVIFRVETTTKVYDSISSIEYTHLELCDDLNDIDLRSKATQELESFKTIVNNRKFIKCNVNAYDYISALKKSKNSLAEYLDILNLGLSDEFLHLHNRVLVIDKRSPKKGDFQNDINLLDGKYKVEKERYIHFTSKLPTLLDNPNVSSETKEKIKSAIRYLRLGNQSIEIEHKFINYWIGLEYLFSNYESQSTILRIKEHFINSHSLAYIKRNLTSFNNNFEDIKSEKKDSLSNYKQDCVEHLQVEEFYQEVWDNLIQDYPLLAYRALRLKKWFFEKGVDKYIATHKENLEIHFIRIYRLRNEIIHDAATNINNELIASNLKYYLTFILNELINYLYNISIKELSIEKYFIENEIKMGNLEHLKFDLNEMLDHKCSIEFLS